MLALRRVGVAVVTLAVLLAAALPVLSQDAGAADLGRQALADEGHGEQEAQLRHELAVEQQQQQQQQAVEEAMLQHQPHVDGQPALAPHGGQQHAEEGQEGHQQPLDQQLHGEVLQQEQHQEQQQQQQVHEQQEPVHDQQQQQQQAHDQQQQQVHDQHQEQQQLHDQHQEQRQVHDQQAHDQHQEQQQAHDQHQEQQLQHEPQLADPVEPAEQHQPQQQDIADHQPVIQHHQPAEHLQPEQDHRLPEHQEQPPVHHQEPAVQQQAPGEAQQPVAQHQQQDAEPQHQQLQPEGQMHHQADSEQRPEPQQQQQEEKQPVTRPEDEQALNHIRKRLERAEEQRKLDQQQQFQPEVEQQVDQHQQQQQQQQQQAPEPVAQHAEQQQPQEHQPDAQARPTQPPHHDARRDPTIAPAAQQQQLQQQQQQQQQLQQQQQEQQQRQQQQQQQQQRQLQQQRADEAAQRPGRPPIMAGQQRLGRPELPLSATDKLRQMKEEQRRGQIHPSEIKVDREELIRIQEARRHEQRQRFLERLPKDQQEHYKKRMEEEERFEKEHRGHDAMHMEMFLLLVGTLIIAQIVLTFWKRWHFSSYQTVTLAGMWIFPIIFAVRNLMWKLMFSWVIFSAATLFVTYRATRTPLPTRTPRLVYWYFFLVHKLSSSIGMGGYFLAIIDFLLGPYLPQPANVTLMSLGLTALFYGLYYGVMGRDFADICSRRMATSIGYYAEKGNFPSRQPSGEICALCGDSVRSLEEVGEKRSRLPCGHSFHDFCIRGWCIVGKKQTCPYCKEKVDLKRQFPSPWARTDALYAQLLDICRYFVVWYPLLIGLVQAEFWTLGLN